MPLGRTRDPFSPPEWLFEIKWDGFRVLAYVDKGKCRLISRNGNQFKSWAVQSGLGLHLCLRGFPELPFAGVQLLALGLPGLPFKDLALELDVFLMGLLDLPSAVRKPNQTAKSLIGPLVCSKIVVPSREFASSQSHVSNMSLFTPVKASAFSISVFKAGSIYSKHTPLE
jgi:hypothetical protein